MALMALVLVGCAREESFSEREGMEITIQAVMAENNPTKTVIEDGTTSVLWEAGDEIKVFFDGTGSRFSNQYTEPSGTAKFSGNLNVVFGSNEGFSDDTPLWGLYPYRADATSDNASVTTTLPAQQVGRAGSFAKGTFITLGKSSSLSMGFYNVCGGVRFSLTQEGIKEVVFQGQNDEDLAGKVKLAFVDGVPAVQEITEGQKTITLTAPNGGAFETGKWYYIIALPGTLSSGFKLTFNTENEYAIRKSSKSVTIKRGIFGSLADVDVDLIFIENGGEEPDPDDVIQFKDPIAKYACVEKFDTNKDGEVSYAEAAAATSLSGLFTDWNTVTEFDEIRFFTAVTSTNNVFTGLSQLKHITIPDNITTLGTFQNCTSLETVVLPAALNSLPTNCFRGCSSLKSVTLPTGITSIPNYAFTNCSVLESLDVPSTITSVGQYAFSGCTVFTGIDMPSGFKTIGNYAFENCKAIVSADFPSSLTSIGQYAYSGCSKITSVSIGNGVSVGQRAFSGCTALSSATIGNSVSLGSYAFSGCSSLVSVVLPEDMTAIPSYCFQGCSKLTTITWPAALTTINSNAFAGCRFAGNNYVLQLPSSVTSIGSNAFGYLHHLVLPSTSPISIASDSFISGYTFLYVPDGMVDMYKVRTNWSNYADKIWPISDYPAPDPSVSGTVGEAVDLGLSVKWASWNVGASAPEEYGAYFAWGETNMAWFYDWESYKWCNGDYDKLTKYCPTNMTDYWDGAGTPDGKTVLDLEDDAARANWGGTWRMPTDAEWTELRNNCTWTWTTQNGVNGRVVTSNINGNSIFLPAAGYRYGSNLTYAGSYGVYWSSSLYTDNPSSAWNVYFDSSYVYRSSYNRFNGFSVRPVSE